MDAKNILNCYPEEAIIFPEVYPSYINLEQETLIRSQLYVDERVPLPEWGNFFIEIGRRVAEWGTGKNRLVVALAIPTKAFAAALAAVGVVLAKPNITYQQVDINQHFEQLRSSPKGTQVFFQYGEKLLVASYEGVAYLYGEPMLFIRVGKRRYGINDGSLTYRVRRQDCHRVMFSSREHTPLCLEDEIGQPFIISDFLAGLIGEAEALQFSTKTKLDCVILGNINTLKQEITSIPFTCKSVLSPFQEGVLQEVLRVQKFIPNQNQPYRSEFLKVIGNQSPQTAGGLVPNVTIFDGATGFIKWRDDWCNSHWIVLLDRTEPHFREAVDIINNDYSYRVGDEDIQLTVTPPDGVELVIYEKLR
jgi:hypothetical protein